MADKAEVARRFGTLALAAVFLITSIAFTVMIFWQSQNDNSSQLDANQQQAMLDQLNNNEGQDGMAKLEGTKLEGFTPITDRVNELQIIDTVEGSGEEVKPGARVTAHYTGAIASTGTIFQSSKDMGQPIPFGLDQVIAGWTEGVPGMKVGGQRRLVIPAAKAYGDAGSPPSIPGDSDLVFDIELTAVENL